MTAPVIAIVNASTVLSEAAIAAVVPALQAQIDEDFAPAWNLRAKLVLVKSNGIPHGAWPIYINRHSADPGALGWHTDEGGKIFGRVFAGDCLRYGVSWSVDLSHEILETILDPDATKTFRMADGRLAAYEACDAVEADQVAYKKHGVLVSDFVLPAYFSPSHPGPYDFGGHLKGCCPALTAGGYMAIEEHGRWTQIEADLLDGLRGVRAMRAAGRRWKRRDAVPIG